jgi:hypothetical protein
MLVMQTCLSNQLKDLHQSDLQRIAQGRTPQYLVSQFTYGLQGGLKQAQVRAVSYTLKGNWYLCMPGCSLVKALALCPLAYAHSLAYRLLEVGGPSCQVLYQLRCPLQTLLYVLLISGWRLQLCTAGALQAQQHCGAGGSG